MAIFVDVLIVKKTHYLAATTPGSLTELEGGGIRVKALAFVSGTQTDVSGKTGDKSESDLQAYGANSNKWLDSGREIPFFETPHDLKGAYSNEDKIGLLGRFSTETITAADIPNGKFSDLVGKTGSFTSIDITRPDAVAKYRQGLIKEISVGLGDIGEGPQYFEASAVPWGAVRGARLFGHPALSQDAEGGETEKPLKSQAEAAPKQIYSLTIAGAMAEKDVYDAPGMDEARRLTRILGDVLSSIKTTTEDELAGRDRSQLLAQAVNDFATKIRAHLNITALPAIPSGGNFMFDFNRPLNDVVTDLKGGGDLARPAIADLAKQVELTTEVFTASLTPTDGPSAERYGLIVKAIAEKMNKPAQTPAANAEFEQRFALLEGRVQKSTQRAEAAERQVEQFALRQKVGDHYMALKSRAATLNAGGKLSAHAYNTYFPEGEQFSAAVERFTVAPTATAAEGEAKPQTLAGIDAALTYIEQFGQAIKTGSVSGQDPINSTGAAGGLNSGEIADTERFILSHPTMTEMEKKRELEALKSTTAA